MPGVAVLGMHRSGTSAITRVLNLLGLHTCVEADLLDADQFNTRGHWESSTVTNGSELLLWMAQAAWWVPPAEREWLWPWSGRLVPAAAEAFQAVHPYDPWVLKDPRLCLTLPFWREAVRIDGIVIACRHPTAIADSLHRRGRTSPEYGIALWERYMRELLSSAMGMPAFVTFYDTLLDDPQRWVSTARGFLTALGMAVPANMPAGVTSFLTGDMRHSATDSDVVMSDAQLELWDICRDLVGLHERLPQVDLRPETPETRRQFATARRNLRPPEWGGGPSDAFIRFTEAVGTILSAPL